MLTFTELFITEICPPIPLAFSFFPSRFKLRNFAIPSGITEISAPESIKATTSIGVLLFPFNVIGILGVFICAPFFIGWILYL